MFDIIYTYFSGNAHYALFCTDAAAGRLMMYVIHYVPVAAATVNNVRLTPRRR